MGNQVKKIIITFFLIFIIYPFFSYSHVNHYEKIKLIEMDILSENFLHSGLKLSLWEIK